jgi:hypothetical protein
VQYSLLSSYIKAKHMNRFTPIIAAVLISAASTAPLQAVAQVSISVNIGTEPPPPRYERIPAPRHGYVWAPGYWDWNGHAHAWREGHWERARSGYVYERPEWRQDNGQWRLNKGGWKREKKHHDRDDDHDHGKHDKHDKHDRHDDDHCPPGQAKKGYC